MKKTIVSLFFILSAVFLFSKEITLKEAIQIGLQNNPDIKSSDADYKSATWQKAYAITTALPTITLSGRATHTLQSATPSFPGMITYDNNGSYGINLSQPIFMGGKIITAYKMAAQTKRLKETILKSKIKAIKAEITSKYYEAVKQTMLVSIAKQQLKTAKKNLAIALQRYNAGLLSKANFLQIQLNKKNAEINLLGRKSGLRLALDNLNNLLGDKEDYTVNAKQKINYKNFQSAVDTLMKYDAIPTHIINRCKRQNLDLKVNDKSLKLSLLSHKLSRADFLPVVSFSYNKNWQKGWNDFDDFKNNDFTESSSYGINFSIPIFPIFNNYSNYKKSLWNYKKTEFDSQKNKKRIITLLKSTYWQFITLYNQIESSKLAMDYANEMYMISEQKFKNSLISSTDLLTAEISYQNAQYNYIKTIYQFIDTKNKLKNILNFENDETFIQFLKKSEDK